MGYMIVRITDKISDRPYIAWAEDNTPIARDMTCWLQWGQTMEILDYQPNRDVPDPFLIPDLNLWRDHLEKEQDYGL